MRYALVDTYSGYVWWVGDAATAEDACTAAVLETGGDSAQYRAVDRHAAGDGFLVYSAPAAFTVDDGQAAASIDAVTALPYVGRYHRKATA